MQGFLNSSIQSDPPYEEPWKLALGTSRMVMGFPDRHTRVSPASNILQRSLVKVALPSRHVHERHELRPCLDSKLVARKVSTNIEFIGLTAWGSCLISKSKPAFASTRPSFHLKMRMARQRLLRFLSIVSTRRKLCGGNGDGFGF